MRGGHSDGALTPVIQCTQRTAALTLRLKSYGSLSRKLGLASSTPPPWQHILTIKPGKPDERFSRFLRCYRGVRCIISSYYRSYALFFAQH
jgi:hypothetical protein